MALEPDCRLAFGLGGIFLPVCQSGKLAGFAILRRLASSTTRCQDNLGEMDEWFKSHAWKACVGS